MYSDFHIMLLLRYIRNFSHFEFWNILAFLFSRSSLSNYKSCKNVNSFEEWARTLSLSSLQKRTLRRGWPHCSLHLPEGDMRRAVLRKYGKILFPSISKEPSLDIILWAWLLDWFLHKVSLEPGKTCLTSHLFKIPVLLTHTLEQVTSRRVPPAFPITFWELRRSF